MPEVIVIAHNIRSIHNVGSIFRTSEGFGVSKVILSGYTPYPVVPDDTRLPHLSAALSKKISKTALGAETMVPYEYSQDPPLQTLRDEGFVIVGLEQDKTAIPISRYEPPEKIALLIGEEVDGIDELLLGQCDALIEIPMYGQKESFNVSVATGIALYRLTSVT